MRKMLKRSICAVSVAALYAGTPAVMAETLPDAVQHALYFNPDVLFQTARKLSTQQGIQRARGAIYPTVDLRAGIGREKTRSPATRAINPGSPDTRTLDRKESSLELVQNIYAGGGIMGEIERQENLYTAEVFKSQGVADDIALSAIEAYLNVLKGNQLVRYAELNLSEHERIMSMIKDRSTAGVSREAELEQAQSRVALARANLVSERANLRESYITYMRVVGEVPRDLRWPRIPSSRDLPRNLGQGIKWALLNHPTLKSAHADIQEARAQHKVANAANYPRVDLVLSASRNSNLDGLTGNNQDNLAMVRMSYNLFRGGSDQALQRQTAYQIQEAFEVKNRTVQQVKESMRLSWNSLRAAQDRLTYLRSYREASTKTLNAYSEQFKVGKRTLLDLLDSVSEQYQSKIDYIDGLYAEVLARYRVMNSAGRLVPYLGLRLPVDVHNSDFMTSHEFYRHHNARVEPENKDMHRIASAKSKLSSQNARRQIAEISEALGEMSSEQLAQLQAAEQTNADELIKLSEAHGERVTNGESIAQVAKLEADQARVAAAGNNVKQQIASSTQAETKVKGDAAVLAAATAAAIAKTAAQQSTNTVAAAVPAKTEGGKAVAKQAAVKIHKHWFIQAGAFSNAANSTRLLQQLQTHGYPQAFMNKSNKLNHIYVGPFKYRGDALQAQAKLMARTGVDAVLRYTAVDTGHA